MSYRDNKNSVGLDAIYDSKWKSLDDAFSVHPID